MNFSTGGGNGTPYAAIPPGRYLARVCTVAFVGNIWNKFQNKDEPSLQIAFEVNHKGPSGKHATIYKPLKASMHASASLRQMIETIESRTLSNAEALAFDVSSLAGRFVWLEIENTHAIQTDGTTKTYDKVKAVFPSVDRFQEELAEIKWDVRRDDIQKLPQRLQKIVMTSTEWKAKHGNTTQPQYAFGQQVPNSAVNFAPATVTVDRSAQPPWASSGANPDSFGF